MSFDPQSQATDERGAVAAKISREIVQLHAELYGRGPTKAKTYVSDDHVLSLLEDVFTRAERTLVSAGYEKEVCATRSAFQDAVAQQFCAIVESATGRRVRAFMSTVNIEPEISAELFVLEPAAGPNLSSDGGPVASDGASAAGDGGPPRSMERPPASSHTPGEAGGTLAGPRTEQRRKGAIGTLQRGERTSRGGGVDSGLGHRVQGD